MALWTPASITTALWLDADDAATITESSGSVSAWGDKSGNSRDASQATGSAQPQVSTGNLNGKDVVSFDGTDDFLTTAAFDGTAAVGVFVVVRLTSLVDDYPVPLRKGQKNDEWLFVYEVPNEKGLFRQVSNDAVDFPYSTGSWEIWGGTTGAGDIRYYIDGTQRGSNTSSDLPSTASGVNIGDGVSNRAVMDVAEIVLTGYLPDQALREKLEGYLAHKWGLEASLPAGHFYKSTPPQILALSGPAGAIKDASGNAAQRTIRVYRRSDGLKIGETVSAADGSWSLETLTDELHDVVVLDDDAGTQYRDIIIPRVTPV